MNGGSVLKAGTGTVQFSRNPKLTAGTIAHSAASTAIQFNQELIFDGGMIDFSSTSASSTAAVNLRGGDGTGITYESSGTATASITYSGAAGGGAGARLSLNTAASSTTVFTIADAPSVDPELDIAVAITGSYALQKSGAGTMRLSGGSANTYNGLTTVSGGILALNKTPGANAIPAALTISGGTARLDAADQIANSSAVTVSGGALNLQANKYTVSTLTLIDGSISGSGGTLTATASAFDVRKGSVTAKLGGAVGLTKTTADTLTLSGANTYSGNTAISAGTLALVGSGSMANSPTNTVASGATFDVSAVVGGFHLASGQTLTGTGTSLGPVTVDSGATLTPGSGATLGTLTVSNNLTLSGSANLRINKSGSTLTSDHVAGISTLTDGGTLNVTLVPGSDPLADGDTFPLFSAATSIGAFAMTNLPSVGAGTNWWTTNNYGTIALNVWPTTRELAYSRAQGMSLKIKIADVLTNVTGAITGKTIRLGGVGASTNNATITTNSTFIFYNPATGNNNDEYFTYSVADGRGGRPSAKIHVSVVKWTGRTQTITLTNSQVTLNFAGIPNFSYAVQRATNLSGSWTTLVTTSAPAAGLFQWMDDFSDLGRPPASAYYRLQQP